MKLKPGKGRKFAPSGALLGLLAFGFLLYTRWGQPLTVELKPLKSANLGPIQQSTGDPHPLHPVKRLSVKPKIAFVIDDMGYTLNNLHLLQGLRNQVTYAVLPHLPYSRFFGEMSRETGAEVILHLPLESESGTIPGPGLITDRMVAAQIRETLRHNLHSVPNIVGANNHMGSRGTADPELMRIILTEFKDRGLFFLDSYTTAQSVSSGLGKKIGLPVLRRDVFLDNIDSQEAVRGKIQELASIAKRKGYAIGIGHYRYNTLKVLDEEIPALRQEGFEIVSLSELIHLTQR